MIEYVRVPDSDKKRGEIVVGSSVTQLFNIAEDPWKTFKLGAFPEHAERVASLREEMKEKAQELRDQAEGERAEVDFWDYWDEEEK